MANHGSLEILGVLAQAEQRLHVPRKGTSFTLTVLNLRFVASVASFPQLRRRHSTSLYIFPATS